VLLGCVGSRPGGGWPRFGAWSCPRWPCFSSATASGGLFAGCRWPVAELTAGFSFPVSRRCSPGGVRSSAVNPRRFPRPRHLSAARRLFFPLWVLLALRTAQTVIDSGQGGAAPRSRLTSRPPSGSHKARSRLWASDSGANPEVPFGTCWDAPRSQPLVAVRLVSRVLCRSPRPLGLLRGARDGVRNGH